MGKRVRQAQCFTIGRAVDSRALALLLSCGLSLVVGCTSGPDGLNLAPSAIPDQGAATPTDTTGSDAVEPDANAGSDSDSNAGSDTDTVTRAECNAAPTAIQARMLELINDTRASARVCGAVAFDAAEPLTWNDKLEAAAAGHSLDMSRVNFFSHTGSDGSDLGSRAGEVDYRYVNLGENLAGGQRTAAAAMEGLIDSPGHCANLMNPVFREVGVACSEDGNSDFTYYWTQVFGRSR